MKLSKEKAAWVRKAARGRVTVYRCCAGPELGFAPRYIPKLAGTLVRFSKRRPRYGWLTLDDAIKDGIRYRQSCRDHLAASSTPHR